MKRIMAYTSYGKKVRVGISDEQSNESMNGHRLLEFGHYRIGLRVGRKYGIVHDFVEQSNGTENLYFAYNLDNFTDRETFKARFESRKPTDLITGRKF